MSRIRVSKSLREVWKWKDEAYREVARLPVRKALEKRLRDAGKTARELGFYPTEPAPRRRLVAAVAEDKPEYVTRKTRSVK